jgi:hypothetical protein
MHVLDKILMRKVEALVTGITANAALANERSERAVADHDFFTHPGQKFAASHADFPDDWSFQNVMIVLDVTCFSKAAFQIWAWAESLVSGRIKLE